MSRDVASMQQFLVDAGVWEKHRYGWPCPFCFKNDPFTEIYCKECGNYRWVAYSTSESGAPQPFLVDNPELRPITLQEAYNDVCIQHLLFKL